MARRATSAAPKSRPKDAVRHPPMLQLRSRPAAALLWCCVQLCIVPASAEGEGGTSSGCHQERSARANTCWLLGLSCAGCGVITYANIAVSWLKLAARPSAAVLLRPHAGPLISGRHWSGRRLGEAARKARRAVGLALARGARGATCRGCRCHPFRWYVRVPVLLPCAERATRNARSCCVHRWCAGSAAHHAHQMSGCESVPLSARSTSLLDGPRAWVERRAAQHAHRPPLARRDRHAARAGADCGDSGPHVRRPHNARSQRGRRGTTRRASLALPAPGFVPACARGDWIALLAGAIVRSAELGHPATQQLQRCGHTLQPSRRSSGVCVGLRPTAQPTQPSPPVRPVPAPRVTIHARRVEPASAPVAVQSLCSASRWRGPSWSTQAQWGGLCAWRCALGAAPATSGRAELPQRPPTKGMASLLSGRLVQPSRCFCPCTPAGLVHATQRPPQRHLAGRPHGSNLTCGTCRGSIPFVWPRGNAPWWPHRPQRQAR